MSYVVCGPCVDCKDTACVTVCPVDCIYEDERMVVIDPTECIDCDGCAAECPVEAIYHENAVPDRWKDYIQLNAERASLLKARGGPLTTRRPLPDGSCR